MNNLNLVKTKFCLLSGTLFDRPTIGVGPDTDIAIIIGRDTDQKSESFLVCMNSWLAYEKPLGWEGRICSLKDTSQEKRSDTSLCQAHPKRTEGHTLYGHFQAMSQN